MKNKAMFFRSKKGMTYVEILVAFALLALIVVVFTPMLMLSYTNLYNAGETNIRTYEQKADMEDSLAVRFNDYRVDTSMRLQTLSGSVNLLMRRIVGSVKGLETMYGTSKSSISIISDNVVKDDTSTQIILLQFTNFEALSDASFVKSDSPAKNQIGYVLQTPLSATPLTTSQYSVTYDDAKSTAEIVITGIDVTYSPVKISVYYYQEKTDTRCQTLSEYLLIEPASIMMVGNSTTGKNYYTTAGVSAASDALTIEGRPMTEGGVATATFNKVRWVPAGSDPNVANGYYVMCGNDGIIRRLWNFTSTEATDTRFTHNVVTGSGANVSYSFFGIEQMSISKAAYKYKWGGDYVGNYYYYINGDRDTKTGTDYAYSMQASSSFNFNGYETGYSNASSNCRRISYIYPYAANDFEGLSTSSGTKIKSGSFWAVTYNGSKFDIFGGPTAGRRVFSLGAGRWQDNDGNSQGYGIANCNNLSSLVTKSGSNSGEYYSLATSEGGGGFSGYNSPWVGTDSQGDNRDSDYYINYLKVKYHNNVGASQWSLTDPRSTAKKPSLVDVVVTGTTAATQLGNGDGTLYLGISPSYSYIVQNDAGPGAEKGRGFTTGYNVLSNDNGTATTVYKVVTGCTDWGVARGMVGSTAYSSLAAYTAATSTVASAHDSFDDFIEDVTYTNEVINNGYAYNSVQTIVDESLSFTYGYASNRALFVSDLVGAANFKSYEKYYKSTVDGTRYTSYSSYTPTTDDQKNIWFTGDYYNLISAAECKVSNADGIVSAELQISAGYAVSGFTEQYSTRFYDMEFRNDENYCYYESFGTSVARSTSLDRITNDGVLAIRFAGDASFRNIFYYKDTTSKLNYRFENVQCYKYEDSTAYYVIFFSDNHGNLWRGIIDASYKTDTSKVLRYSASSSAGVGYCCIVGNVGGLSEVNDVLFANEYILLCGKSQSSTQTHIGIFRIEPSGIGTVSFVGDYVITGSTGYTLYDLENVNGVYYACGTTSSGSGVVVYATDPTSTWSAQTKDKNGVNLNALYSISSSVAQ